MEDSLLSSVEEASTTEQAHRADDELSSAAYLMMSRAHSWLRSESAVLSRAAEQVASALAEEAKAAAARLLPAPPAAGESPPHSASESPRSVISSVIVVQEGEGEWPGGQAEVQEAGVGDASTDAPPQAQPLRNGEPGVL